MSARSPFNVSPSNDGMDESSARKKTISRTKTRCANIVQKHKYATPDSAFRQYFAIFVKYFAKPLLYVAWICVWVGRKLYAICQLLPLNLLQMIFGAALCFFGGVYFVSISAIEAFRNLGGQLLMEELTIMWEQGSRAATASIQDDTVDADHDGVADVQQMSYNEFVTHKCKVCMQAVSDPKGLMNAVQYFLMTYTSVLAVLRFQFAKTIALCIAIADMLELPFVRIFAPLLSFALGPDLHQWVHPIISTTLKIIAVIVASYVQAVISAFYSGLRGGRLFAMGLINLLGNQGIMDKVPDWIIAKPFNADESWWDEIIAYPLAAIGFYFQFTHNFALSFPLNLLLLPLTTVEWILRWQVFTGAM